MRRHGGLISRHGPAGGQSNAVADNISNGDSLAHRYDEPECERDTDPQRDTHSFRRSHRQPYADTFGDAAAEHHSHPRSFRHADDFR